MTPTAFRTLAHTLAGPHWRTKLCPMIGKKRTMVFEYARGTQPVPDTVAKLMRALAAGTGRKP